MKEGQGYYTYLTNKIDIYILINVIDKVPTHTNNVTFTTIVPFKIILHMVDVK